MPKVTATAILQDGNQNLPAESGHPAIHFQFELPGVSGAGVLFFRLRVSARSKLRIFLNEAPTLVFNLETSEPGSFHEIYPFSTLSEGNNQLTIEIAPTDDGELGSFTISDVMILYQVTV